MTKKISLNVELRDGKVKADEIRRSGYVPGVLYGGQGEPMSVKVKQLDFERAYGEAGESSLLDLAIDGGGGHKVLIKEVAMDAVRGKAVHFDLYRVDMSKPIEVDVPIVFTGVSKAVSEAGGVLVKSKEAVAVRCLPKDMLEAIEVDLARLAAIGDQISVADLALDGRYEIMDSPDDVIAGVSEVEQYVEEAPTPAPSEGEVAPSEGGEKKEEGGTEAK